MLITPRGFAASLSSAVRPLRVFLACAAMVIGTAVVLPSGQAHAATAFPTSTQYRASLLAGVNAERTKRGLPALRLTTCLNDTYAQPWSVYMAIHKSLTHQSMSRMLSGCHASIAAENVGYGAVSAASMVKAWMASAGHRANILDSRLRYIGVGAAHSHSTTWYAALDFSG